MATASPFFALLPALPVSIELKRVKVVMISDVYGKAGVWNNILPNDNNMNKLEKLSCGLSSES